MNSIKEVIADWTQTGDGHKAIHEGFINLVNQTPFLKAHRDFVETNIFGFGERSFQWMWKLIVDEMPKEFTFLEIGVFRGQILSLIELLANESSKKAIRYGVTPLSTAGGMWESNYEEDIKYIHDNFKLNKNYNILKGDSTDPQIISEANNLSLDILYIDGGHTLDIASSDIANYAPLVKKGGYLVIDDCANDFAMPWGYFTGIQDVTNAVNESKLIEKEFEFLFSVVHIKVWRKK